MTRAFTSSTRVRILAWILVPVMLLLSLLVGTISYLVTSENSQEIDSHLAREANELELLARRAIDPSTGASFSSAQALLSLYISRTIPDKDETMFVVANGLVFARTTDQPDVRLDLDPQFLEIVQNADSVTFGNFETEIGTARFVVAPVRSEVDRGALVAVIFADRNSSPIRELILRFAIIALFSFAAVASVGWLVAGKVLAPIQSLRKAAHEIAGEDLSQRIEVSGGNTELNQLAHEFNLMLDRIAAAFESQQRFIDDAGHELRTPLTVISGHFELLTKNPEDNQGSIEIIQDEIKRMARLVQDLQTLTKSSSPQFLRLEAISLMDLADQICSKARQITSIPVECSSIDGRANVDPQRITQALLQFVENASKYASKSTKLTLEFYKKDQQVIFAMKDKGPGVPAESLPRLFEPFFRGKGQQNEEGSGLGLALVMAIAKAHGGEAHARNLVGGGAEFSISIPEN